jgi:hypothetical protein
VGALIAIMGFVGVLQGVVWTGSAPRAGRKGGGRRGLLGAALAPIGLSLVVLGLTAMMVPDFLGGR